MEPLATLIARHAQPGTVTWLGQRPERLAPMQPVPEAEITATGLTGDHARPGKRAVTLIQAEHLPVIAALAGLPEVLPDTLRRNIVVAGINLAGLRKRAIRIGSATLTLTGPCAPCSRMETALGPGGYSAMRGHGGWCATVETPGTVRLGDTLTPLPDDP